MRLTEIGSTQVDRTLDTAANRAAPQRYCLVNPPIETLGCWSLSAAGFPRQRSRPTRRAPRCTSVTGAALPTGSRRWPPPTSGHECPRHPDRAGSEISRSPTGEAMPQMVCHRRVGTNAPPHQTASATCCQLSLRALLVATTSHQPRCHDPLIGIQLTDTRLSYFLTAILGAYS